MANWEVIIQILEHFWSLITGPRLEMTKIGSIWPRLVTGNVTNFIL